MIKSNVKKLASATKNFVCTHQVLLLSGLGIAVLLVTPQGVFASFGTENNQPLPVIENNPSVVGGDRPSMLSIADSNRTPIRLWSLAAGTSLYMVEHMVPPTVKPAVRLARALVLMPIPASFIPSVKK